MNKLYKKSEIWFAVGLIILYSVLQTVANTYSKQLGVEYLLNAVFNIGLTVYLFCFIKRNRLMEKYGLCRSGKPARMFLWYIPLAVLVSHNLWNGVAINLPLLETTCYIIYMLCVGFVEEVLFRGLLFKAIARDNLKSAVIISSVTFGLGHFLNLVNGAGMGLVENICQVVGAIAVGFLFVLIVHRGGSLIPCIITHSGIDIISVFSNPEGLTSERRILFSVLKLVIVVVYILVLLRTLPPKEDTEQPSQAVPEQL